MNFNSQLISIIVPVYNVEDYLEKCVYSIINQKYKNLEIILVNDGSIDNSGLICEELSKLDNRIKVYHKKNGGLSDARNYGVDKAKGEYIGFVDSDDYIHENMYSHLYEVANKEDADVVECSFLLDYGNKIREYNTEIYYKILDREGYLKEYLTMERVYGAVCWKLIKAEIAKKIKFPIGKFYEDAFYSYELINIANKYVITSEKMYYYLMRPNSITNKKFEVRHVDNIEISNKFLNFTIENYKNLEEEAFNKEVYAYFSVLNKILELDNYKDNEYLKDIISYFRKNLYRIIKNNVIPKNRKLSIILICLSLKMYSIVLFKYMEKIKSS